MDNDDLINEFVKDCEAAYALKTGMGAKEVGFDPVSIFTAILAFIMQICPKPPAQLKADAEAHGLAATLTVRSATRSVLREKHPRVMLPYRRFGGDAIADAVLDVAASKDVEKIRAVQECCGM